MFPLKSLEIFKENSTRYEFASNHAYGRIFDYSPGAFMSYYSTKILFKNGICEEIINENAFEGNSIYTRRIKTKDNLINFSIISHNFVENESFDTVISFDTIQFENNFNDFIKKFFNLLKKMEILFYLFQIQIHIMIQKIHLLKNQLNHYYKNISKILKFIIRKNLFLWIPIYYRNLILFKKITQILL